ncbi:hypothetical protein FE257_003240 [Aspergillus nanangensis]|uniref:Uncharacterized protein n=1 Tax=Aspergillus nanangensis TaxID=2582783 RepID=A0AAD4CS81_ASPNN|nr:hypothetical protein FE257_003240 [Aspergillus nanangensis]
MYYIEPPTTAQSRRSASASLAGHILANIVTKGLYVCPVIFPNVEEVEEVKFTIMEFVLWKTPFRRPPSRPTSSSRPSAGPQFASTPRFLLSQQTPGAQRTRDVDIIDTEESPHSTPLSTTHNFGPGRRQASTHRHKDIIEDSDDEPNHHEYGVGRKDAQNESGSSPPENADELNVSFEALFPPTTSRVKRRRASLDLETPSAQRRRPGEDSIASLSPDPTSPTTNHFQDPYCTPGNRPNTFSRTTLSAETPRPSTSANHHPSFRGHPRFLLSTSQVPSSSQPYPTSKHSETPVSASPAPRKKPGFVLPRSPSPDDNATTIPTPFSPSSRALRRRGRTRSAAPSYLPGGMAAEVRSWILEMGTKRDQLQTNAAHGDTTTPDMTRYAVTFRIFNVRQSALPSSGSLAFVRGYPLNPQSEIGGTKVPLRNYLLLGTPRFHRPAESPFHPSTDTARVPELEGGDVIGICRGLVWELDLTNQSVEDGLRGLGTGLDKDELSSEDEEAMGSGKWMVAMEWELLPSGLFLS